jgi:hypothetical protein
MSTTKNANFFYCNFHALGWWGAILFMIGSLYFATGALFSLGMGELEAKTINSIFFIGSLFFTMAAYIEMLISIRSAQSQKIPGKKITRWFGWYPADKAFMVDFIQWIGTLLFNINTLVASIPHLTWLQMDIEVWTPDIIGCLCFLFSSVMVYKVNQMKIFSLKPKSITWWVLGIDLWGSIFFMLSGVLSFVLPHTTALLNPYWANLFTLIGAFCFFLSAYLMIPEMSLEDAP